MLTKIISPAPLEDLHCWNGMSGIIWNVSLHLYITQWERLQGYNWRTDEGDSLMSLSSAPQQGSDSQHNSEGQRQKKVCYGCSIQIFAYWWVWKCTTAATRSERRREEFNCNNLATY